jgi:hypothetical protein
MFCEHDFRQMKDERQLVIKQEIAEFSLLNFYVKSSKISKAIRYSLFLREELKLMYIAVS